jgi:hypothetical protein
MPWRPRRDPPQLRHLTPQSVVGGGGAPHAKSLSSQSLALGQKQTSEHVPSTSALPQKRTSCERVGMSALCQKQTWTAWPLWFHSGIYKAG